MGYREGKVLKVDVTDYHILDIMADPAYMPYFVRRYHIAMEMAVAKGTIRPWWSYIYENNPKLLYDDCVDEVKRLIGIQETSASSFPVRGTIKDIVLNAASDWITEKTGRTPEFEIFPNTVKSARTSFKYYGRRKKENNKEGETSSADPTIDLGHPGTPPVREEPRGGDEIDDLL